MGTTFNIQHRLQLVPPDSSLEVTAIGIPSRLLTTKLGNQFVVVTTNRYGEPASAILTPKVLSTYILASSATIAQLHTES